jgi:ribosomal RNA-processing protein 7
MVLVYLTMTDRAGLRILHVPPISLLLKLFPKMTSAFSDFTPLPLAYSPEATHYLYIRAHNAKKPKTKSTPTAPTDIGTVGEGSSIDVLPPGRTLFVVNVPPDATERELSLLFKPCGTVERVVFPDDDEDENDPLAGMNSDIDTDSDSDVEMAQEDETSTTQVMDTTSTRKRRKKNEAPRARPPPVVPLPTIPTRQLRRSGRSAHLVFLDESSLQRSLAPPFCPPFSSTSSNTSKPHRWPPVDPSAPPRGLAHYLAKYRAARPPLSAARAHADAFMARYDHAKAQERRQSKYRKGEAIVDEDGFTLVTRGGAYGQTVGGGVGVASKKFQDLVGKKGVSAVQGSGAEGRRGKGRKKREGKEKDKFYKFQVHEERRNGRFILVVVNENLTN